MLQKYEERVQETQNKLAQMTDQLISAYKASIRAFEDSTPAMLKEPADMLKMCVREANELDNDIIKVFALYSPEANELRMFISFLKITGEIVRMTQGLKKFAKRMKAQYSNSDPLEEHKELIINMQNTVLHALEHISQCLKDGSRCNAPACYRYVMVEESKNDDYYAILEKAILSKIAIEGSLSVEYVKILQSVRRIERAADHAQNIAKLLLYAKEGGDLEAY